MTGLFRIKPELNDPVPTLQCRYCRNKFKGNDAAHSRELLKAHIRRKHPEHA